MGGGGGDFQPFLLRQPGDEGALFGQLVLGLIQRVADGRTQLYHGLVQLRFQLALDHHYLVVVQKLGNEGAQLARLRVDDLIFFFNADGQ
jgi:hypothetical protein